VIDTARFEGLSVRIAGLLPAAPASWHRVTGGHRADPAWRVALDDGRSVFVKIASDPVGIDDLRHEHALYRDVEADFLPRLVAWDGEDPPILVLEDVNEDVYRIDRMLTQLRLSGLLQSCAGIAFGAFTDMPGEPGENIRALDALFDEIARDLKIPAFAAAPIGHIDDQWTVPLGAMAEIDADSGTLSVEMK
jgi:hypothetical protein